MRRLLRILFNIVTLLSLVLCAATMAAWVRSYEVRDVVWWSRTNQRLILGFSTYRGGLCARAMTPLGALRPRREGWDKRAPVSRREVRDSTGTFFDRLGFALDERQTSRYATREIACNYWFITLLTAILPGARLVGWRRRARRLRMRPGLCRHCGYDCRATPDRCPECGTPAAAG